MVIVPTDRGAAIDHVPEQRHLRVWLFSVCSERARGLFFSAVVGGEEELDVGAVGVVGAVVVVVVVSPTCKDTPQHQSLTLDR